MRPSLRVVVRGGGPEPRDRLTKALNSRGYSASAASGAGAGESPAADIVLVVGEETTAWKREAQSAPHASVIVVDERPELDRAVAALRAGAADYVVGTGIDAVEASMRRVSARREISAQLDRLDPSTCPPALAEPALLGESPALSAVRERIERLGSSVATVLITGESGTGKEVAARVLHRTSPRRTGPFIAVNCGAIPSQLVESEFFGHVRGAFTDATQSRAGLLAQASGGTLFLDEVAAMPLEAQVKLLRALQERSVRPLGQGKEVAVDIRLIAASDRDLSQDVEAGTFRRDLFFRLNVVSIQMPPLRERGLDVLLLAQHFIFRFAGAAQKHVIGMTAGAARVLLAYDWPGNVRELSNWMEAAVALARYDRVTEADLRAVRSEELAPEGHPVEAWSDADSLTSWNELESRHIAATLRDANGNKARAARLLGIDRKTLYRKLKKYALT